MSNDAMRDALREALEKELKEGEERKAREARLRELMPRFASEEEALAYAGRLLALKPGQVALAPVGDRLERGVYVGHTPDNHPVFLFCDREDMSLASAEVCWGQVVLEGYSQR